MFRRHSFWIGLLFLVLAATWHTAAQGGIDKAILDGLRWRSVGPLRGGRSIAVSGVKGRPKEGYFGAVGGGLWKTIDGGLSWTPVTDNQITTSSVGAVAVSESNSDVVFIGTGESCIRGNIMPGDGVYKTTDAGKTWAHVGFKDSDAISKIRIHPTNPNIVFVADFGKYGATSDERGIFKSTDGGSTWKKVLFKDNKSGGIDVEIDRRNPNVMFAALWEAYRVEYQMSSGGPGSGLYKSSDGGETWKDITRNPGLPSGVVGKISVAISGADPNRIYALIENDKGGLYSSDDGGATWKLINEARSIRQRAFYYTHVFADPNNKDVVIALNTSAFRSTDGGKTFAQIGQGTHGDNHDFWFDPDDSNHVMLGNDGGGVISYDVSSPRRHWTGEEYATGQFYHVITTTHVPYHVCGAQQDNTTMCVSSATQFGRGGGGGGGRGNVVPPYEAGGGEPGYIAPDPSDPDVIYAGANNGSFLTRLNRRTGELKEVGAYPRFFSGENSATVVERWQWTYPIIFSPVDPKILYTSSQHIWKSTNGGDTWERISGDLTRHDPKTMQDSGGPITHDMNSPEIYATVFSLAPGKTDANVIWAGSDDGVVSVTRDAGRNWAAVTPKDMPEFGRVSQIDASSFDAGTAYVSVKKPLLEDFAPYIWRTHDFGRTWTKIVAGIAANDYVSSVREDPKRRGLLYAGVEHGIYVSLDDGDHWESLRLNLPDTQVSDIWVEQNDVAIATHGRGFYILDDVNPLRQFGAPATTTQNAFLFKPGDAIRGGGPARIDYWLKKPAQDLTIQVLDAEGKVVRTVKGAQPRSTTSSGRAGGGAARGEPVEPRANPEEPADRPTPTGENEEGGGRGRGGPQTTSVAAGLQRFAWDLQSEPVLQFPGMVLWGATQSGPVVPPGTYQVKLTVDGASLTEPLTVTRDKWIAASDADLQAQYRLASDIRDKVNEANQAIVNIRRMKKTIQDDQTKSQSADIKALGDEFLKQLSAVEESVYQVRNQSNQDPLNFPIKTNNRLASLLRVVETGNGKPTSNVESIFSDLKTELKAETDTLQQVTGTFLPKFNELAKKLGLEEVK
jgi:photosystem II stability/assembly factor-like uncharacterized protein